MEREMFSLEHHKGKISHQINSHNKDILRLEDPNHKRLWLKLQLL